MTDERYPDVEGLVEAHLARAKSPHIGTNHKLHARTAAALRTLRSRLSKAEGERDGWSLPEIEQDDDGEITFCTTGADKRHCVSWTLKEGYILRVESDLDNRRHGSDRLSHRVPTPAEAALQSLQSEAAALRAERDQALKDKARLDFLDDANRRLNARYGTTYAWKLAMNHNVNRLYIGHLDVDLNDMEPGSTGLPSCRAAIDERMHAVRAAQLLKDNPNET